MALPKSKISKARGNSRFANWKLTSPNLIECSHCHEMIESHIVCPQCGYYKDRQVVVKKVKEDK